MNNDIDDLGLFGPETMVWRLHSSKFALVGGIRALMVQALEPRAMAAVEEVGGYRKDPLGRLNRTISFVQSVSFGTRDDADRAIRSIKSIHSRVKGIDPHSGRSYDASDPIQLAFVHNALVESVATAHEIFDCRVNRSLLDQYVSEMRLLGLALGADESELPSDLRSLKRWIAEFSGLEGTDTARQAVGYLKHPVGEFPFSNLWRVAYVGAIYSLSEWQREALAIDLSLSDRLTIRARVGVLLTAAEILLPSAPPVIAARERAHRAWRVQHGLSH